MKIRYTKKRLRTNLIVGLFWLGLGIAYWLFDLIDFWLNYYPFVLAFLYLGLYLYERQFQYLTITEDQIKVNDLFGKRINISKINRIKKYAGDYILITDRKELRIDLQIVDPDSLIDLNRILAKLNLPPEKTPFANNTHNLPAGRQALLGLRLFPILDKSNQVS